MYYIILVALVAFTPYTSHAQSTGSIQGLISGLTGFISQVAIPLLLGIAFLAVVWNTVRFFIIGADNEESQQNAKNLALYSVAAFVLFLSFWGIVQMISNGIGLAIVPPCEDMKSDYQRLNTQAPCSSIRPMTNPNFSQPNIPNGGNGPSMGGSGGTNQPPSVSGVTDPTLTTPTNPGLTTPPAEKPLYDYSKIATFVDGIRAAAKPYFDSGMNADYGANVISVKNDLFADLPTSMTTGYSDTDRAVAMYRLQELGVLTQTTVPDFIAQVNAYNTSIGSPATPLSTASIKAIAETPTPLPGSVVANMDKTKTDVTTTLGDFNFQNTPEVLYSELFDPTVSPDMRMANFQQYYSEGTLYDRFAADIKTEKIFKGIFTPFPTN